MNGQGANISKDVCIVGNAVSLMEKGLGAQIDKYETVIRLNKGFPQDAGAQGSKTSLVGVSCPLPYLKYRWYYGNAPLMWMTPRRGIVPSWMLKRSGFSYYPIERWEILSKSLGGKRPSTGLMMIDYVCGVIVPVRLKVVGFDFKATNTLFAKSQKLGPHDWVAEKEYVFELIARGTEKGLDWEV